MARIKIAYLGGGSSRAPGTMASFIHHGAEFDGSEFVLIDLDPDHLEITRRMATQMAKAAGLDITVTATTDMRAGVTEVDAVLSSFRPGGFEARAMDERIPLKYGVIGQETQGPGGLMMSLRSAQVIRELCDNLAEVAPKARIFNYTNPVNIVSQVVADNTDIPIVSFCEGPIVFPPVIAKAAGLDPAKLKANMTGVNHNVWSNEATYDGRDAIEVLRERWEELRGQPVTDINAHRAFHLAVALGSIPSDYFNFYYFRDELLREQQLSRQTRSQQILSSLGSYWAHYTEQADSPAPRLDPACSRGGIHELELAIDAMSAFYNDTGARLPFNIPNTGGILPGFDENLIVEVWGTIDAKGFHPEQQKPLPHSVLGITQQLAEYQLLAAKAGWEGGTRDDAVRAMIAHPLVPSLPVAEALYDEMAVAQAAWLPERLLNVAPVRRPSR
jgi:6-phospho-beta-glucosidase